MVHILDNLSSKHCSDLQKLSLICYVPMWQNKSLVDTKKAIKKYLTYFRNIRKNRKSTTSRSSSTTTTSATYKYRYYYRYYYYSSTVRYYYSCTSSGSENRRVKALQVSFRGGSCPFLETYVISQRLI